MKILNGFEPDSIRQAASLLGEGGVVAFPTETVYGLGADAYNPYAVARIFEIKRRPSFDPLIVHIDSMELLYRVAAVIPSLALRIIERFWPGPLTIILKKRETIPDIVTAGLSTVGVRMPSHPVARSLIQALGGPIAAPSANPFGYVSSTKVEHVVRAFQGKVPMVLDGGDSEFGLESTIVSFRGDTAIIHRHGAIPVEDIRDMGTTVDEKERDNRCEAPGQLPYHYAPTKPLKIIDSVGEVSVPNSSFLGFKKGREKPRAKHVKYLSKDGDLRESAANFFSYLIDLDREDIDLIYAERIPERGLGRAMMERLRKAAQKRIPYGIEKSDSS